MSTYLTIMMTILVATQIIRIIQNTISLFQENKQLKGIIAWKKEQEVSEEDSDALRECIYLLREKLMNEERE